MHFDILTLFPDMVRTVLGESILGRGEAAGCFSTGVHNIRDYSENRHRRVDDTPYGGGMGMVMAAPPIVACHRAVVAMRPQAEKRHTVYLSPRGRVFTQKKAEELLQYEHLILLCGHYEGVDERAIELVADEEISIGDYVLTGGELPACILVDSVARMLPGVLADPACYQDESISGGLLEYPQYTRPPVFEGIAVPEVLLSGHHGNIDKWRHEVSFRLTKERRPDLITPQMQAEEDARNAPKKRRRRHTAEAAALPTPAKQGAEEEEKSE